MQNLNLEEQNIFKNFTNILTRYLSGRALIIVSILKYKRFMYIYKINFKHIKAPSIKNNSNKTACNLVVSYL
jgi:hypothetical protein